MDKKEAYREKSEAQFKLLKARIDELAARADKMKAEAKIEYAEGIEALKSKKEDVKRKLKKLQEAGAEASQDLKAGLESALFDLKKAVDSAVKKFK
jgi:prefoldin subunit 5